MQRETSTVLVAGSWPMWRVTCIAMLIIDTSDRNKLIMCGSIFPNLFMYNVLIAMRLCDIHFLYLILIVQYTCYKDTSEVLIENLSQIFALICIVKKISQLHVY